MKDKHAVTRQWLSIPVRAEGDKGKDACDVVVPDRNKEVARLLQTKKLRRGWHEGNSFDIVLRDLRCADSTTLGALETRLQEIAKRGVPNYFGEQRFGEDNLTRAIAWLPRRRRESNAFRRGLNLSVLRSFLFNEVLSARIKNGSWCECLEDETVPEGPLWGRGRVSAGAPVVAFESDALSEHMDIASELEFAGLSQERRALQLVPEAFSWRLDQASGSAPDTLWLQFFLPPGTYATSVLRELGRFARRSASESTPDSTPDLTPESPPCELSA